MLASPDPMPRSGLRFLHRMVPTLLLDLTRDAHLREARLAS